MEITRVVVPAKARTPNIPDVKRVVIPTRARTSNVPDVKKIVLPLNDEIALIPAFYGVSVSLSNETYFAMQKGFSGASVQISTISRWRLVYEDSSPALLNGNATIIGPDFYSVSVVNGEFTIYHWVDESGVPVEQRVWFFSDDFEWTGDATLIPEGREYVMEVFVNCLSESPYSIGVQEIENGILVQSESFGLEYSLDGGPWNETGEFDNVPYGVHRIDVRKACLGSADTVSSFCYIVAKLEAIETPSFTLSYSIDSDRWVSFHDFFPLLMTSSKRGLSSFVKGDGSLAPTWYSHEKCSRGYYYGITFPSYIDIATQAQSTGIWTGVEWSTEAFGINGKSLKNKTIDSVSLSNSIQTTGDFDVSELELRNYGGTWRITSIKAISDDGNVKRDILEGLMETSDDTFNDKNHWEMNLLQSPYIIARFKMLNETNAQIQLYRHISIEQSDGKIQS